VPGTAADAEGGGRESLERQVAELTAQLVAAHQERNRMVDQLMNADRLVAMGRLAAGVGHEINNPLTYVLSGLSVLADELDALAKVVPPERLSDARDTMAEMRQGLDRIRQVVRDLKTFSRPDEEPLRPVAVADVIESSLQMTMNEIRHRAALVKELGPVPPVLGNASRLGQVFLNLLVNATQAIPEGAADRNEIRVVSYVDGAGFVVIEIRDTGTGIAPDLVERVFEPFFTTREAQGGTGLGLSISRNLVASMGGAITVESRPEHGSCFRIRLPPAPADEPAEPSQPAAQQPYRARVLVVDDDPLVLNAVRRTLVREHDVVGETSGRAALARIEAGEAFDLVLCDLMMPEMGGAELHAALATLRPELAARTAFLTGGAFTAAGQRFLDSVPNPCIEKPFDPDALRARLRRLLEDPIAGGTPPRS
jgi:signal transduction histidine kinase/ActR/RegA family two-component response regulator